MVAYTKPFPTSAAISLIVRRWNLRYFSYGLLTWVLQGEPESGHEWTGPARSQKTFLFQLAGIRPTLMNHNLYAQSLSSRSITLLRRLCNSPHCLWTLPPSWRSCLVHKATKAQSDSPPTTNSQIYSSYYLPPWGILWACIFRVALWTLSCWTSPAIML